MTKTQRMIYISLLSAQAVILGLVENSIPSRSPSRRERSWE